MRVYTGTDAFVEANALEVVKEKGVEGLARQLARIPNKKVEVVIAAKASALAYIEQRI